MRDINEARDSRLAAAGRTGSVATLLAIAMLTGGVTPASAETTDTDAPAPVRGLQVSADTTAVTLDWRNSPETDLRGYQVLRSDAADGAYTVLTPRGIKRSRYVDSSAPVGLPSYYRVVAVDTSRNTSEPTQATGVLKDATTPDAATALRATRTDDAVQLSWTASASADLDGYIVLRSTTRRGSYARLTQTPIDATSFADTTAAPDETYFYRVVAVDYSGNRSDLAKVQTAPVADTTAPAAPADLVATGTPDGVSLDWADSTDADLAGYDVYRSSDGSGTYDKLTETPITASDYADDTAPAGVTSFYRVVAVDTAGNASDAASASGEPVDTAAPSQPTGLAATGTDAGVSLDWADQDDPDLAGYFVARSATADGTYTTLTDSPITASAYEDTTAPRGPSYYRVTAVDAAGNVSAAATAEGIRTASVAGADVTVAQDGSGDFATVADALAAAPSSSATPYVIGIQPGVYRELLTVSKPNITFLGATDDAGDVVISYDNAASTPKPDGTGTYGTSGSATVLIRSSGVTTRNLTIENAYVETGVGSEQAVALKTQGDRLVFDNVRLLGDQDTLYADSPAAGTLARSYYTNSYVEGDVDFVFGRGTAVFDDSTLMASTRGSSSNNGYVTAASTDKSLPYGFLITDSVIESDAPANTFHLGRPWQPSGDVNAIAQVVVRDTVLPAAIKSSPWTDMSTTFSWRDARFFEYNNTGPGAGVNADRPQLSDLQAQQYTKFAYLAGSDGWNPTGETPPPPPADTTAPAAPADLAATPGDSKVDLSWTANAESDLAGYDVYRSTSSTVALTAANKLTSTALTGTSYTDRTAANGTTYYYAIVASDVTGNQSAASATVSAAPVGVPIPAHDILVAADGTGQFTSIQAAVDSIPSGSVAKKTIAVKSGVYSGVVTIQNRYNITIVGATGNAADVVITAANAAGMTKPDGSGTFGTDGSATFFVKGNSTTLKDLTVENAFDEAAVVLSGEQAVALFVQADKFIADNVRLLGNQDTLYLKTPNLTSPGRSYINDSYIEGDVDFIFGHGTAVIENSTINALSRGSSSNNGYITAASTDSNNPYGILITDSTITSNAPANTFSLGRPWQAFSTARGQVTIRNTELPAAVRVTQPWADMSPLTWRDGRFFEYANTGPGATVNDNRPQLTDEQAGNYTAQKYLAGADGWNPTGR